MNIRCADYDDKLVYYSNQALTYHGRGYDSSLFNWALEREEEVCLKQEKDKLFLFNYVDCADCNTSFNSARY